MGPFFIGKRIAINCFREVPSVESYVHFVTHVSDSLSSLPAGLYERIKPLYTSSFFAWYMSTYLGVPKNAFVVTKFGEERTVYRNDCEITFVFLTTKALEPNFMILFKNETGDELFASQCKFTEETLELDALRPYLSSQTLAKIYFDGSYMNSPRVPSLRKVMKSILTTIKANRRKIVFISANRLGNEAILSMIAKAINKKICVTPEKYAILSKLGVSNCFTTEPSTTYIRTIEYKEISVRKMTQRNSLLGPTVTIVLSMNIFLSEFDRRDHLERNGIYVFPLTSLDTPSNLGALKRINTRGYSFTHLVSPVSSNASEHELSSPNVSRPTFRSFSRNHLNHAASKLLKKCEPDFWMTWRDYIKWRRNDVLNHRQDNVTG